MKIIEIIRELIASRIIQIALWIHPNNQIKSDLETRYAEHVEFAFNIYTKELKKDREELRRMQS